jgi:hypothetical protein
MTNQGLAIYTSMDDIRILAHKPRRAPGSAQRHTTLLADLLTRPSATMLATSNLAADLISISTSEPTVTSRPQAQRSFDLSTTPKISVILQL